MNLKSAGKVFTVAAVFFAATANAENVEITLIDMLDGVTSSYCLDIKGSNTNADPSSGLQAHTCYSYKGQLGEDQVFDTDRFTDNILYMPEYNVCAEVSSLEAGATVGLSACNGDSLQSFAFSDQGIISPTNASDLCLTAAADTRFGRSKTHQIKALTLEVCSDDLAGFQQWRTRTSAD